MFMCLGYAQADTLAIQICVIIPETSTMKPQQIFLTLMLAAAVILIVCPVQADSGTQSILYQTNFATNPYWTTNNPSTDYWNSLGESYNFGIQPSTGNYAYSPPINYEGGSFTLDYDVTIENMDPGATFRLGFTGADMDFNKGPNVITAFTNTKDGLIMVLHTVSESAIQSEVSSAYASYGGPTVNYQLNTTYHVDVNYNNDTNVVTETVTNKQTGQQLWSYFTSTQSRLRDMNRIYLGNVGDYGAMDIYAVGYIDSVRLTATAPATPATPTPFPVSTKPTFAINQTILPTITATFTPIKTVTNKSPLSGMIAIAALGAIGAITIGRTAKKKR